MERFAEVEPNGCPMAGLGFQRYGEWSSVSPMVQSDIHTLSVGITDNKMSTYRIILDDGKKIEVHSSSAASAIQSALGLYRGRKVNECYLGMKQEDVDFLRLVGRTARPSVGFVQYEVPDHDPLPFDQEPRSRPKDLTRVMFDEDEILRESENARRKQEGPNFD
jgi:hypothetical protein